MIEMITVCQNCYREPEPFKTDKGITGYYCVVPDDNEPSILMSDLTERFMVCSSKIAEPLKEGQLWCIKCVESINEEE